MCVGSGLSVIDLDINTQAREPVMCSYKLSPNFVRLGTWFSKEEEAPWGTKVHLPPFICVYPKETTVALSGFNGIEIQLWKDVCQAITLMLRYWGAELGNQCNLNMAIT